MPAIAFPVVKSYPLAGVTLAQFPNLAGHVLHDELVPINSNDGKVKCRIQARISRSDKTGKIDLDYRIQNLGATPVYLQRVTYSPNPLKFPKLTFADYRLDGLGTIAPTQFYSSKSESPGSDAAHQPLNFEFAQSIPVGGSTRFFFLSTDAVDFGLKTGWIIFDHGGGVQDRYPVIVAGPANT